MTTFDDKEKAAENKYAHDKEVEFRVHARRNKLFGLWTAEKIGFTGDTAEHFAKTFVTADWETHSDDILIEKARNEFSVKGISVSDHDIRAQLHHLGQKAKQQVVGD